jgi:hypothetical protein
MKTLKEMIENKNVTFQYYRDGELWYATEDGFKFPVPVTDVGTGVFKAEDKAILFMRWIRKQLETVKEMAIKHIVEAPHSCEPYDIS